MMQSRIISKASGLVTQMTLWLSDFVPNTSKLKRNNSNVNLLPQQAVSEVSRKRPRVPSLVVLKAQERRCVYKRSRRQRTKGNIYYIEIASAVTRPPIVCLDVVIGHIVVKVFPLDLGVLSYHHDEHDITRRVHAFLRSGCLMTTNAKTIHVTLSIYDKSKTLNPYPSRNAFQDASHVYIAQA